MKEYKFNWRFWFYVVLFGGIQALGFKVVYMLWNDEVTYENGSRIERPLIVFLCTVLSFVLIVWFLSVVNLLRIFIKNKGCGLVITERGIENTVVILKIVALFIAVPIRCIPWESIKYFNKDDNELYIRVYRKNIDAGLFGKLIISFLGYRFCDGLVKPKVMPQDVEEFEWRFSTKQN